ncbi:hypothetical protein C5167_001499 [Papaver somniferum]|uniref:Uncharacterized protein n=1 Tax=Papaver somniferum TaxID=3469 RepID=A0A4Y7KZH9_PAPSO|nr:uncharacterized protein LOC113309529 [Papaver somniferum]RZC77369.1 hypothetical protein C5167_001499 [Papaver somniferum]
MESDTPATTTITTATDQANVIQHVNKVSSDQLLRKFAAMEEDYVSKKKQDSILKRDKKRCRKDKDDNKENENSPSRSMIVERRSLLPITNRRSSSGLLRKIGIGRSAQVIKAREMKNKSFVRAIGKTWRKTVEGASKVFVEKHYNRHNRLINDFV